MGWVLSMPAKIGEHKRQPGYELTEKDMAGRNLNALKRQEVIHWQEDRRGPGRPRKVEDE